jgi:ribosomal protein L35
LSGTGKVRTRTAWGKHLFKSKSASRQMRLKADKVLAERDAKRVRRMLGS